MISAIAAGNCVVLKPSELAPNCEQLIVRMIAELFPPEEITVITGGVEEATQLLELKWDHIFFTGSPPVGKNSNESRIELPYSSYLRTWR